MGRGGSAPAPPPRSASSCVAAAHRQESGETKIRATLGFGLSFYTTGVYLWAVLDHGPGWKFKWGRIFLTELNIYRAQTKLANFGHFSVFGPKSRTLS